MEHSWMRIETSQVVSNSPACVGAILITAATAATGDITLYDGTSASDPKIAVIKAWDGQTNYIAFQPYLVTSRGLYVTIGSNVEDLVIQFAWSKE